MAACAWAAFPAGSVHADGEPYALGSQMRSVVPYYPLLMQTKSDTLLYQEKDDASSRYMTLGQGMYVSCWPRAIPMPTSARARAGGRV
ncbi:MAG: hypothetical protein ACLS6G_14120 [Christensenellales bacterium]